MAKMCINDSYFIFNVCKYKKKYRILEILLELSNFTNH